MNLRSLFTAIICLFTCQLSAQQQSTAKFGKITAEDFKEKTAPADSSANAIVVAEIGSTNFVGNQKGNFSLEFKKFRRVHILNKNGYDAAKVEIEIYTEGEREEQLTSLKAVTYNLENGKVVETQLDKSEVFKDKINKNLIIKKFTFPNIKEGSIIEYKFELHSDFIFHLQPWDFQSNLPCLWSEYNVSIPEFYKYISIAHGYQPFYIKEQKDRTENFYISESNGSQATEHTSFSAGVTDYRWVMKDVPALKEESFTSTINNHISRIEFQLNALAAPFTPKDVMGTWQDACTELLKDEDFGASLSKDNPWLNDVMADAKHGATSDLEKARNIFIYVRDNITCTGYGYKYLAHPLKTVLKTRNGNEAEINLLLTAMLLKAGLNADPVILSTRSNGYSYAMYPLLSRFNFVITKVQLNGKDYFLDASHPKLGFNKLTYDAYNVVYDGMSGHARVVNNDASPLDFVTDSLNEKSLTSVIIINDEKGNLTGTVNQTPGYPGSYSLRNRIKEKGKDQYFAEIKKGFNAEIEVSNPDIDSLDKYDDPVFVHYDFNITNGKEDIIYLNPMFGEAWKENPFKSAKRLYPVEMPYTLDETYLLRMDVPKGYTVDEMPKQIMVRLNDTDDSFFEYVLSESNDVISIRSRVRLDRTIYMPDEYESLRAFFNLVVKKQSEQIVFKKKK